MHDFVQYNYHTYLVDEMLSSYQTYREEALGMHRLIPPIHTQPHMLHVLLIHPHWLSKAEVKFLPRKDREGPEGKQTYSSDISVTSALGKGG